MSFFPRSYLSDNTSSSFTPLFRLLDDFDQYNNTSGRSGNNHSRSTTVKTFTPRFDVKEIGEAYELHGELPGIEQKDVEIEFIDEQTLQIRGRTERSYTSGTPPSKSIEGAPKHKDNNAKTEDDHKSHQPTVEDESAEKNDGTSTEVTRTEPQKKNQEVQKHQEPQTKYWVSERSVGEFSRSFSFPVRVEQDAVKASMKNGILSIVVPKAKKQEGRKITIQ